MPRDSYTADSDRVTLTVLTLPVLFFTLCVLLPLAAVFIMAVSGGGLSGLLDTATDSLFVLAVRRTVEIAGVVTVVCWILGVVYAVALVIASKPVRLVLWGVLLGSLAISLVARTYGWTLLLRPEGQVTEVVSALVPGEGQVKILGTTAAVYIGMVHVMLPFMVLPLFASLRGIDPARIRAAHSMGSTGMRVFRRVVLPEMRAGTIAGVTLVFLISFGFFVTPAMLGGPSDFMVSTLVDLYFSRQFDYATASAVATWVVLGVMMTYVVADRFFDISKHWSQA